MKYFTFFPGLIVVFAFTVLLILTKTFGLNVPLMKNIRQPLVALVIAGLMMCAFGTLAGTVSGLFKGAAVDVPFVLSVLAGILLLVVGGLAIFSGKPVFGLFSKDASFYVIASLIAVKIILSTIRVIRIA